MKALIACTAAALTLAACQRPAEETATSEDAVAAADSAMDTSGGAASSSGGAASGGANGAMPAESVETDGADTVLVEPAAPAGPSEAVRDTAKERAEETNLHPRTP